jgi:hypothetical protein
MLDPADLLWSTSNNPSWFEEMTNVSPEKLKVSRQPQNAYSGNSGGTMTPRGLKPRTRWGS